MHGAMSMLLFSLYTLSLISEHFVKIESRSGVICVTWISVAAIPRLVFYNIFKGLRAVESFQVLLSASISCRSKIKATVCQEIEYSLVYFFLSSIEKFSPSFLSFTRQSINVLDCKSLSTNRSAMQ